MKQTIYKSYIVRIEDTGRIEVIKNGELALITKPILREIAPELGVEIESPTGKVYTTRQLGNRIYKAILNRIN